MNGRYVVILILALGLAFGGGLYWSGTLGSDIHVDCFNLRSEVEPRHEMARAAGLDHIFIYYPRSLASAPICFSMGGLMIVPPIDEEMKQQGGATWIRNTIFVTDTAEREARMLRITRMDTGRSVDVPLRKYIQAGDRNILLKDDNEGGLTYTVANGFV